MDAECIAHHGVATEGDAFVEVQCAGQRCVCRVELLGKHPKTVEQTFEAKCESAEQAEQLLKARCVPSVTQSQ